MKDETAVAESYPLAETCFRFLVIFFILHPSAFILLTYDS